MENLLEIRAPGSFLAWSLEGSSGPPRSTECLPIRHLILRSSLLPNGS